MQTSIVINAGRRDITVQPTRVSFPGKTGTRELRWLPAGNGVAITGIEFDDPSAPVTPPRPGSNGEWTATWNTDEGDAKAWKYSVTVSINGTELPTLDPEVENGPPSGKSSNG